MYFLIPFKSMKELTYTGSLLNLYEKCLESDNILIQDTKDMVVEKFSLSELHELESKNRDKVYFRGFSTVDYCDEGEKYAIINEYIDIVDCDFLNDTIKLEISDKVSWMSTIFGNDDEDNNYVYDSECKVVISGVSNTFTLQLNGYFWEHSEKCLVLLSINDTPVMFLCSDLLDEDCEVYFEVVQFCKTKSGFDLVLYLPQLERYFGVKLTEDLRFSKFVNIKPFVNEYLTNKNDWKEIKVKLAKNKILGKRVSGVFCTE